MKRRRGCESRSTACRSKSTKSSAKFSSSKSSARRSSARKTKRRKSGLAQLEREIENLRETSSGLKAHWQNEKESIQRIRSLKEKIESTKVEEQKAQRRRRFEPRRRAALRHPDPAAEGTGRGESESSPSCKKIKRCSRKRSTPKTSPKSSPNGPAFRSRRCSKARSRNCSRWKIA